ncbi:MAG: porphobilinogen synthase [Myxococcota bacterium]|nr:porphobilinogen synthase [Myxococcota bacterium]
MSFPIQRLRRLRSSEPLRRMVRETKLAVEDLVHPLFVVPGAGVKQHIGSMPGQYRYSVDELVNYVQELVEAGILAVLLFGIPESKDPMGSGAYAEDGIVQRATRALSAAFPELIVITDVCMCEYTSHGHCGHLVDGCVLNDPSLELLAKAAVSQARAGSHMLAPSDMMDGRVGYIRRALDEAGFSHLPIMSYAAKFASGFYGPFREAADSTPQVGDRRGYQMDPANAREALLEMQLDAEEGADILMVKPALPYLDILARARPMFSQPLAAYHVSGEYAMVKAAAAAGWLDEQRIVMESLTSIKRAGADIIMTYYAHDVARWLNS